MIQALHFDAAQPCNTVRRDTIMIEQVPLSFVFHYGVVGCPSYNRVEQHSAESEWPYGESPVA